MPVPERAKEPRSARRRSTPNGWMQAEGAEGPVGEGLLEGAPVPTGA